MKPHRTRRFAAGCPCSSATAARQRDEDQEREDPRLDREPAPSATCLFPEHARRARPCRHKRWRKERAKERANAKAPSKSYRSWGPIVVFTVRGKMASAGGTAPGLAPSLKPVRQAHWTYGERGGTWNGLSVCSASSHCLRSPCCFRRTAAGSACASSAPAFALQAGIALLVLGTPWRPCDRSRRCRTASSNLLGYAKAGTDFIFGPIATPRNRRQQLRDRGAAGDHLLRLAGLDPLLSRHHAARRQMGRRRDPAGSPASPRSKCLGAAANIFVGQSESPLVIRPYLAALTPSQLFCVMTVGMAGVAGTILARLCRACSAAQLSALSARGELHVGAGRHPDGQDHHARRACRRDRTNSSLPRAARGRVPKGEHPRSTTCMTRSGRPTSSWPPRRARRPASSWRSRSARWCWPSSRWSRSPTACSAGSAAGSAIPTCPSRRSSARSFAPVMYLIGVPWNEAASPAACSGPRSCSTSSSPSSTSAMPQGDSSRDIGRDRHLRAVRLRQFQLDRDPDGGDRRPRAQPAADDRASSGCKRAARGLAGQSDERGACRD